MRRSVARLVALFGLTIVLIGCTSSTPPIWTFGPIPVPGASAQAAGAPSDAAPAAGADMAGMSGTQGMVAAGQPIAIEAFDLGFRPATLSVPAAGIYEVDFRNTGAMLHNVTFADGTVISADAGKSSVGHVTCLPAGSRSCVRFPGTPRPG